MHALADVPRRVSRPKRTALVVAHMTNGEKVIAFIEKFCRVPEGALVGQPMRLEPFQRRFILDVIDNPKGTRLGILSVARKNGKTPLIAGIVLAFLAGPMARRNAQIASGAMSQKQAATVFRYAAAMVRMSPELSRLVRIKPSTKTLVGLALNVEYNAISREKKTAHGMSPLLAILDEVGQIRGPQDDFVDAITTAQGAYPDALLLVISTQAPSDADLLSVMIDDALRQDDPHTVCHLYAADKDCELDDPAQWRKANPAMGVFRDVGDLRRSAQNAARIPANEAGFRNLMLNQRVAMEGLAFSPAVWKANNAPPDPALFRRPGAVVHAGLDLSGRVDLTACVLSTLGDDGSVHLLPFVFTPLHGVEDRERRDKAPYSLWIRQGHLIGVPGPAIDYDFVCTYLLRWLGDLELTSVQFDRWRITIMREAAARTGLSGAVASWVEVGQGFKDISPRVEAFEVALLAERVRHGGHPLLTMAAANAIAVHDAAGARKLDKSKSTQRIDPLVAAVMASYPCTDGAKADSIAGLIG